MMDGGLRLRQQGWMTATDLVLGPQKPAVEPLPVEPAPLRNRAAVRAKAPLRRLRAWKRELSASDRALPGVLIIGAQKAGTTSLHEYMTSHPLVASATVKEVHYFDLNFHRGLNWYRAHFPKLDTLRAMDRESGCRALACEGSPYYLAHPLVPYRVRGLLPAVKLIAVLRDPIQRALSHHNHEVEMRHEQLPFEAAVDAEAGRLAGETARMHAEPLHVSYAHLHHSYLQRGHYAEQLEIWLGLFERDQLLVLDAGALLEDPDRTMRRVWDFLELPFHAPHVYRGVGTRRYRDPREATRRALVEHFAPHNERLFELIGERFDWSSA
jgi:Sulfotransferase domain